MAYNKLKQGVEIMQGATQGAKVRYFLNGKEISEQEAMEPASPGVDGWKGGVGPGAEFPNPMRGASAGATGVPPGVDPEEWKQFLQSRPQNVSAGGRQPMMEGGQGYQGPMMEGVQKPWLMTEMPIERPGTGWSRMEGGVGNQGPIMAGAQQPWLMTPQVSPGGPTRFWDAAFPVPKPMMPKMPPRPRMSPKEMEDAIASDQARYRASIMPPSQSPGVETKPKPQRLPPIQVGGGAIDIAPVDPGMTITPEQKPNVSPASTDIKPRPAKEPPQTDPPQIGSTRDRRKKGRIKPQPERK